MKTVLALIVLVVAAGLLARFNPDKAEFRVFVKERVEQRLNSELGTERVGRIVTAFGTDVAGAIAARMAVRTDYVLYSIYSVDLGADGREEDQWRFVGVAGEFFELSRPEILQ